MLDYTCLGRCKQLQRLEPLLLVSIVTLMVTAAEAHRSGPQIITYGESCTQGNPQNLPYQIQEPVIPKSAPGSPSYLGPPGGKLYNYGISAPPSQWSPSNVGFQLPVSVQEPVLPRGSSGSPAAPVDPLRGRTYGIGIQSGPPSGAQPAPLGSFDFGIQESVPTPKNQQIQRDPSNPFGVQVQPGAFGRPSGGLWGPLPIDRIERPAHEPNGQDGPSAAPPKRLTGLTSTVDRLLIPACDLPMGGPYGSGGNAPYGSGASSGPFGSGGSGSGGPYGSGGSGSGGPYGSGAYGSGGSGSFGSGGSASFGSGSSASYGSGGSASYASGGSASYASGGSASYGSGGSGAYSSGGSGSSSC